MIRADVRVLGVGCAAALAFAGCGSSGKSSSSTASSPSTTAQANAATGGQTATSASQQPGITVATKRAGKLGRILAAGPKKLTVYLFEADRSGQSACQGACAQAWPPVTTSGAPNAMSGALASDLGVITRPDGTKQLTYRGHPLYYYMKDKDSGDAYGEGLNAFGGAWYALNAKGAKVDLS